MSQHKCEQLDKPCQIFEIGLGRTGTRSVCEAVRYFGFNTRHGFDKCPECSKDWLEKRLRGTTDAHTYSTCEYSGNISSTNWKWLVRDYPEAKFILTERPVRKWLRSWSVRQKAHERWLDEVKEGLLFSHLVCLHHFDQIAFDRKNWRYGYEKHNDEVKSYFDGSCLLVLNVFEEDGQFVWDKLAKFLGCDAPKSDMFLHHGSSRKVKNRKTLISLIDLGLEE